MITEAVENGGGDMEIDGFEQKPEKVVPDGFDVNYLKIYYGKLFPYTDFFKWMSYGNDGKHPGSDQSYFGRREFSFTLENDIYLRYQSFNNLSEMENSIKEKCPFKIDIGPVYNVDVLNLEYHQLVIGTDASVSPLKVGRNYFISAL